MTYLTPHHANLESNHSVNLEYSVASNQVVVEFKVKTDSVNVSDAFSMAGFDNPGLWDFDVVEVFIQRKSQKNHYLELQCSPLGQKFALLVKKPRQETIKIENLNTQFEVSEIGDGFKIKFTIPASDIPGDGSEIYANFFACLGASNSRSYYGLNINSEKKPDYHRPELFKKIGQI